MLLFPWIATIVLLVVLAALVLITPAVARTYYRERRFAADRPRMRAVLILTAIELALILVWTVFVLSELR